jgi:NTE family protein
MRLSVLLGSALLFSSAAAIAQTAPDGAAESTRPRIGLVLSGGGARGTTHIGVLKVLDDLHIKVDAIAGTSMGAVIGGLYASGLSGRQIEQLFSSVDWQDAFRDRPRRGELAFRRKEEDQNFLVNLPLGLQGRNLLIPQGFIQGQKLTQILRRATLPVEKITDFDHLPIRFRAVATDLVSGQPVVMASGDLTSAMRASMSAPGVFIPVQREGKLLVDGGLVDNLPIDVARSMGVDVLIVVDAGSPLQGRDKLDSVTSVSNQAIAILVDRNVELQRATLTARDVYVRPQLQDIGPLDFKVVSRVVQAGEVAARAVQPQLSALSLTDAQLRAYAAAHQPSSSPLPTVEFVKAAPDSQRYARQIKDLFGDLAGKTLDPDQLDDRITTLYGRGYLESLDYRLDVNDRQQTGLLVSAQRNSWGPNYLSLGLSLQNDFNGNATFNAAGRLTMTELNWLGAELVTDLQIGADPRLAFEFYQPLSNVARYFIAPHAQTESYDLPQIEGGQQIGYFTVSDTDAGLDLGRELGNWGEIRVGGLESRGSIKVRLGDFSAAPIDYNVPGAFVRFSVDRLDSFNFPHSGEALTAELHVEGNSATTEGSDQVTLDWRSAWSVGKYTAVLWLSGGSTVGGSTTSVRTYFPVGGFLDLSGLVAQSLAGPQYAIGRAIFLRSVGSGGEGVLNVPAYVGVSFEGGNVWSNRNQISFSNLRHDESIFLGADTFIGPVYLAAGYDDRGSEAYYLFVGHSF